MRRFYVIAAAVMTVFILSACSPVDAVLDLIAPTEETMVIPGKLVTEINIVTNPYDESMVRSYVGQERMSAVLRMLQNMQTREYPAERITFDSYSQYYTITATYVNGEHTVYHLLDGMYLRSEGEDWCIVDSVKLREFEQYLLDNPTGDAAEKPTDQMSSDELS